MTNQKKTQVKVFLAPAELRLLRLAAANRNVTASAFLKEFGLAAAAEEMQEFSPPGLPGNVPPVVRQGTGQRARRAMRR